MYSLDVNFLKDRNISADLATASRATGGAAAKKRKGDDQTPIIVGTVVGLLFVAASGGYWWQALEKQKVVQAEIDAVTQQIAAVDAQNAQVAKLTADIATLQANSQAFVQVLQTNVRPWSAVLAEISDLAPPGLQIESLSQIGATGSTLQLTGFAKSFNDINDFVLNLQKSKLFIEKGTFLTDAALVDNPAKLEFTRKVKSYLLPKLVSYNVTIEMTDMTKDDVLKTLETNGARGMAERLKTSF